MEVNAAARTSFNARFLVLAPLRQVNTHGTDRQAMPVHANRRDMALRLAHAVDGKNHRSKGWARAAQPSDDIYVPVVAATASDLNVYAA